MNDSKIESAIVVALDGKYEGMTEAHVVRLIRRELELARGNSNPLMTSASPTLNVESDVRNHIRAYVLLEQVWRLHPPLPSMIEEIYGTIYGLSSGDVVYRASESVPDFSGVLRVPVTDVRFRTSQLNLKLATVEFFHNSELEGQAEFLADLFSGIVAVHPFQDGNGRTARLVVQYCLRRWGRQLLLIPKVKNDSQWRSALVSALDGDRAALTRIFMKMMRHP